MTSDNGRKKGLDSLAVILPRYGESLGGGAETLVRSLVQRMAGQRGGRSGEVQDSLVKRIEVWTTCAVDHRTWENYHPSGAVEEDGIVVRRFPVSERNLDTFIGFELALQHGEAVSVEQQLDWLANSVNSKALYAHITRYGTEFDALLFAPYLFATSFWGALIYPERSLLVPCLHNEPYAYLEVFHHLFRSVRGFLFNTQAEMELAGALYDVPDFEDKAAVVGMGFEGARADRSEEESLNRELTEEKPFLLYSGRKEKGKNLDLLIECFEHYRSCVPDSDLELRIMGSGSIDFLEQLPQGVVDLGFVSEGEKQRLVREAVALCQPSVNESFSIVMMEAWLEDTPVIVHEKCPVTWEHVKESGGGLCFTSAEEFVETVSLLIKQPELRREMGQAGHRYVNREYSWAAVTERLSEAFSRLGLRSPL